MGGRIAPVFVDFGPGPTPRWILAEIPNGSVDVAPFGCADLIERLREGDMPKAREFDSPRCYG